MKMDTVQIICPDCASKLILSTITLFMRFRGTESKIYIVVGHDKQTVSRISRAIKDVTDPLYHE